MRFFGRLKSSESCGTFLRNFDEFDQNKHHAKFRDLARRGLDVLVVLEPGDDEVHDGRRRQQGEGRHQGGDGRVAELAQGQAVVDLG